MSIQIQDSDSILKLKQFLSAGENMQKLAARLGIHVRTIHDINSSHFLSLPAADQAAVMERLKVYSGLLESAASEELLDEKRLLWFALSRLRLAPYSGLMDLIGENDLVEVYVGPRQVYRSFNYYNYCSYSLDELESIPWNLLFSREEKFNQQIFQEIGQVLATREVLNSAVPAHEVREIRSVFKNKFLYHLKHIVPLKDLEGNRQDCVLGVLSAQILETAPLKEREKLYEEYFHKKQKELDEADGLL